MEMRVFATHPVRKYGVALATKELCHWALLLQCCYWPLLLLLLPNLFAMAISIYKIYICARFVFCQFIQWLELEISIANVLYVVSIYAMANTHIEFTWKFTAFIEFKHTELGIETQRNKPTYHFQSGKHIQTQNHQDDFTRKFIV